MVLENQCREILEQMNFSNITKTGKNRIITLFTHDIAMAADSSGILAKDLIEEEPSLIGEIGYTLWGRKEKSLSMSYAVQYNAMAVTESIREDFVNGIHPGAIIFPILYAESEKNVHSFQDLITSAAIGLKLASLLNCHLGSLLSVNGYRPTTIISCIAASGALAWLRYKDSNAALQAMAAATGAANGFAFPFQEGTEEWLLQVPLSAHTAIAACNNIRSLTYHHQEFLTGEYSLGKLLGYKLENNISINNATNLLMIGVKKHPVNSFVQPVVEGILQIVRGKNINPKVMKSITITVPESFRKMEPNLSRVGLFEKPNLSLFSIPISGAIALMKERLLFNDLQFANDQIVQELAKKFCVIYSAGLTNYDIRVDIQTEEEVLSTVVPTSIFYPDLDTELSWIRENFSHTLYWVEPFINKWMIY